MRELSEPVEERSLLMALTPNIVPFAAVSATLVPSVYSSGRMEKGIVLPTPPIAHWATPRSLTADKVMSEVSGCPLIVLDVGTYEDK